MSGVLAAVGPLADDVNNFGDTRGGALAGPTGLFLIVMLALATVFLIRSMNKRLRRLPASFPDTRRDRQADDGPVDEEPPAE